MTIKKLIRQYIFTDIITSIITWLIFCFFRRLVNDIIIFEDIPIFTPTFNFWLSITFYPLCCLFISYLSGFYDKNVTRSRIVEIISTIITAVITSLITFFVILLDDIVVSYQFYYQSFLVLFGIQCSLMYIGRFIITQSYFHDIRTNKIKFQTLIIGTGLTAKKTADSITGKIRFYGSNIVGFVQISNTEKIIDKQQIIGNFKQIDNIIKKYEIQTVFIATDSTNESFIYQIINKLILFQIEINIIPRQVDILTGRIELLDIDSMPFISLSKLSMPAWQRSIKRTFDLIVSAIGLILMFPVFIFIAIRIKVNSHGPVFYKQERIGKYGKPFIIYKFRSMYENAEHGLPQLTKTHDPRITSFGKTLRKYRLDELPQLYNIIKGEMSFVGPRPERQYFIRKIMKEIPYYCLLYKIQPGLLSWGPIKVGYTHSIDEMKERLNYDIIYMDNMSLFTDLKIMVYSIEVILKGKGI